MTTDGPEPVAAGRALDRAVEILAAGGLVVLPTDTVYGLAARASSPEATNALFACKDRGADVPIAVLCADMDQAFGLAGLVDPAVRRLAEVHWPGALTLVLPRRHDLAWELGEPAATIGVRCPDHSLIRALATAVGPLATTSANRHGEPTPSTAAEAATSLACRVDLVIDGGTLAGHPSTVVDGTSRPPRVLRQGEIAISLD